MVVELLENLYPSFITLNNFEKAEMARIILSNFKLDGSNLLYDYKKPFSFFAEGLNCSIDLGLVRGIRTFYEQNPVEFKLLLPMLEEIIA